MNNSIIEKSENLSQLYDYYKKLLTEKQAQYFELYFFEDLTFQEIADEFNVTRNAIFDSIHKTSLYLQELEEKLFLKKKSDLIKEIIEKIKNNENVKHLIEELEKIL